MDALSATAGKRLDHARGARSREHEESSLSEERRRRAWGFREAGVALLLLATLSLGVLLRAQLAGALFVGVFAHLRHAHSHLGYYGVLFPALWAVWSLRGGRSLSPATLLVYGIGSVAAAVGFATSGYGAISIPASTVVGAIWLWSAVKNRALAAPRRLLDEDWLAGSPIAVLIACGFIPFIALSTSRDPALAQALVRTFLGVLLFGAVIPAAMSLLEVPAPRALLYLVVALLAAVAAGADVHPLFGAALVLVALVVASAVARARHVRLELRAVWLAFAGGTFAYGLSLVPHGPATSVAALHFVILAPLLVTFAWHRWPTLPTALVRAHLGATLLMVAAIYLGNHPGLPLPLAPVSALSGGAILVVDAVALAWIFLRGERRAPRGHNVHSRERADGAASQEVPWSPSRTSPRAAASR